MNHHDYYQAYLARDPKYDGIFYLGVTSTGIYCRPVCTARRPKPENCIFFNTAEEAEKAGFRACRRCRPELVPGSAPVDDTYRIAIAILAAKPARLNATANRFELSPRQIRRITQKAFKLSPIKLLQQQRLQRAEELLKHTDWPMTRIALESGFRSLRRFNAAFLNHYGMTPTHVRKAL